MSSITIRNLDDALASRLQSRAIAHGWTVEDEAREILAGVLSGSAAVTGNLAAAIRARFAPLGGVELPMVPREPMRDPPSFDQ